MSVADDLEQSAREELLASLTEPTIELRIWRRVRARIFWQWAARERDQGRLYRTTAL